MRPKSRRRGRWCCCRGRSTSGEWLRIQNVAHIMERGGDAGRDLDRVAMACPDKAADDRACIAGFVERL